MIYQCAACTGIFDIQEWKPMNDARFLPNADGVHPLVQVPHGPIVAGICPSCTLATIKKLELDDMIHPPAGLAKGQGR